MFELAKKLTFALALGGWLAASPLGGAEARELMTIAVGDEVTVLTDEDFERIGLRTIQTANDFTDGVATFEGPLARDVLAALGLEAEGTGRFIAANDYAVEIPLEDFANYDVVFAVSMNGSRLSLRDKGPVWIIYPMSDHAELRDSVYNARLIWQLTRVELE